MASEPGQVTENNHHQHPADYRDGESVRFLYGVCSRDIVQRTQALDNVLRTFDSWIEGYGSPKDLQGVENHLGVDGISTDQKYLIEEQMPDLLRLNRSCPYEDVRQRCSSILKDLEDRGLKIPRPKEESQSSYIPAHLVVSIENNDDEVHNLYVDAYLHNNRLEHVIQVMGYHPKYLDSFLRTQHYMLRGDGPLPYEWRHYIAIMAAGRHQCGYVMKLQINEFLLQGGDERWLKGLNHVPQKLRDLYEINKILAHRPWLIGKDHIEKLRRGNDSWSLSELMQAVVLMAHFHSMCSFVYGCGITPEIDHEDGHTMQPPSPVTNNVVNNGVGSHEGSVGGGIVTSSEAMEHPNQQPIPQSKTKKSPNGSQHCTPHSGSEGEGGIEELMQRMRKLTEDAQLGEDMTQEELLRRFERIESLSAELPTVSKHPSPAADILRFVDDTQFRYQDFAKRGAPSEIPTFRAQDYSWEEQGFSLANRLYSEIGTLLDDKFQVTKDLTYYTMGDNIDVDTTSFRRAIWNYIHCMFGIRHDDYDYIEVNQLLERSLKSYIKTVTCFPESVTRREYDSFMREFKHSEKVHVNLMLLEARLQGELLYALRAINRFIT